MNYFKSIMIVSVILSWSSLLAQSSSEPLSYFFDRHYGQVEVGGRFAGAEFHESRPIPSRISFYYPVANSIDVSTDYWKRGNSLPFALGIRAGKRSDGLGENRGTTRSARTKRYFIDGKLS